MLNFADGNNNQNHYTLNTEMEKHDFVTIANLSKEKILYLIEMAEEFEKHPNREILKGRIVATLFFEASTRTRLSFETAANRLGAKVIGFSDAKVTSATKGETLKDTILMVSNYADVIVMRHYVEEQRNMHRKWLLCQSSMPETAHISILHSACLTYIPYIKRRGRSRI